MIDFKSDDWAVLRLATKGRISSLEIDTNHFKGNFPESCLIEGCSLPDEIDYKQETTLFSDPIQANKIKWVVVLPRTKLAAHEQKTFELDKPTPAITHVRLTIYPDGGVSRLRLWGQPVSKL
uniref:Allantoicase domain-containing protein n=1 Tax=Lotharella oceanica TaxID=641309 RepID=A0A7S2TJX7_9EUKA|mmetsp:Transcript_15864/g.30103  ORF Transcript_15864/g.30103 Transcript_15864/m.30103 type:complete len:122 (+) Transcript_15864:3-368(+)